MPARILIIEDNPDNLELMGFLLRAHGHFVLDAPDGETGVALARSEGPDLILCDIQLPRLDGYGVIRHLKSDAAWRRSPVVAVTAFAMVGDREKMLTAGFDGYLSKPIAPQTFARDIDAFLPPQLRAGAPGAAPGNP
ncbi:MAG TPA: response regulator [Steroidobacteraceae bacterium]|nr:response regulator [Steroidobacteraceae bacterium]